MTDLIFHLGLTKTASSFLQRRVFNGKINTCTRAIEWDHDREIAKDFEQFFFKSPPESWRQKQVMERYLPLDMSDNSENVLISHESLCEHPFTAQAGKYMPHPSTLGDSLGVIAESWSHGSTKAFFLFRRQDHWLPSSYAQNARRFNNPGQMDFERRVDHILESERSFKLLDYSFIYDTLVSQLGDENVLAIPYEAFSEHDTWGKIREFTAIDYLGRDMNLRERTVNVKRDASGAGWRPSSQRYGRLRAAASRFVGQRTKKAIKTVAPNLIQQRPIIMPDTVEKKVMDAYREGNRRMGARIGVDLSEYGYY